MNEVSLHPLVEALAEVERTTATELDYVLANYVDADAVRQLMAHADGAWSLDFEVPDHRVTVGSDGWILVDDERVTRWAAPADGHGGSEASVT